MFVRMRALSLGRMRFGMLMRMVVFGLPVPVPVCMSDDPPPAGELAAILDADLSCACTFGTNCFYH